MANDAYFGHQSILLNLVYLVHSTTLQRLGGRISNV